MSSAPDLPPLECDLPPKALHVLSLARRIATPCGDGDLVWHVWGDDAHQPLVLLHGGSGSWTHWIRNVEALAAAGRRVVVPDLPGFGDSARPPGGQDVDSVAPAVAEGIRQVCGEAAVDIAGFSFGGLCGAFIATDQPQRVRRLLLVGAPGLGLRSRRLPLTSWRDAPTEEGKLAAHRANLATLMIHDAAAIDELALRIQAANVPRDRMHRRKLALTDILLLKLPEIRCPLFAIYGEQDALYLDKMDELRALLERAPTLRELVVVPGAGHWVPYEASQACNREMLRLLAI